MQTIQSAFMFVFGHLAPKPLTVSTKTKTLATPFYRNRKQTETAFSICFGSETETKFWSVCVMRQKQKLFHVFAQKGYCSGPNRSAVMVVALKMQL